MKRKLFSIDTQLYKVTGVEKVMLDIHHAVRDDYEAKIVGTIQYRKSTRIIILLVRSILNFVIRLCSTTVLL